MARTAASTAIPAGVFATPVSRTATSGVLPYITWFVQLMAFFFLLASLLSFSPYDWPSPAQYPAGGVAGTPIANWCGTAGAVPAYHLFSLLSWGVWVLMGLWGIYLFATAFVARVSHPPLRLLGAIVMAAAISALHALLLPTWGALPPAQGGGMLGVWLANLLQQPFGGFGAFLWLLLAFIVGAVVAVDVWVIIAPKWAYQQVRTAAPPVMEATATAAGVTARGSKRAFGWIWDRLGREEKPANPFLPGSKTKRGAAARKPKDAGKDGVKEAIDEQAGGLGGTEAFNPDEHTVLEDADGNVTPVGTPAKPAKGKGKSAKPAPAAADAEADADAEDADEAAEADDDATDDADESDEQSAAAPAAPQKRTFTPEELRAKIAKLPVVFAGKNKQTATEADLRDIRNTVDLEGYKFPGLDLLEEPDQSYPEQMEKYVREQAGALERALKEYRIDGEVVGIESGPVITLFEVRLAAGTKVAVLSGISSDLARALKAVNIRIVPNTAGRDTVGIEVPNAHKEKVRLKELMTRADTYNSMTLPMFLGKDASGNPLIVDLATQPHMLIAGTTGSGKSVCMSSILMSFLYTRKPNELKLVLVDPKMVELSQFKDIPHLMCPVVTEMSKAAAILEWAVRKMDERYELLAEAGCRDISSYNSLTWEELKERFSPADEVEEARIPKKLPYMVFVIDELADLMMTNKEVEHAIVRLAQKARAVGMHLIVATQRPQANVVTGLIKANMPGRISFKVASAMDSRIVLDQKGGELLLGMGDMLYLSPKTSKLMRSQGTLVDDREIRKVVKFLKEIAAPSFEHSLMQIRTGSAAAGDIAGGVDEDPDGEQGLANAQADPMFNKAVEIVLETNIGSVSMLQRRLAIGYTRASRLIDAMGKAGIIGNHKGTVAREVLISADEWEAMKAQAEADAAAEAAGGGSAGKKDAGPTLFTPTAEPKGRLPASAGAVPGSPEEVDGLADEFDAPFDHDGNPRNAEK